ncbi:hypothetical protein ACWESM_17975 [Nocardia sp. NPDC003999]
MRRPPLTLIPADVTSNDEVSAAVARVVESGAPRIVVNCAGCPQPLRAGAMERYLVRLLGPVIPFFALVLPFAGPMPLKIGLIGRRVRSGAIH